MKPETLFQILSVAEKLKCTTRHCCTTTGRPESVAEHSWRISLMAMLVADEFPDADMDKVIRMCVIHDLGEAFTGDIPTFQKNDHDANHELLQFEGWISSFPEPQKTEFRMLLDEMEAQKTMESKIYKSLDKLEAVIQHNEVDISTWLPLEYELQLNYARDQVAFSPYFRELKAEIDAWTRQKITNEAPSEFKHYAEIKE